MKPPRAKPKVKVPTRSIRADAFGETFADLAFKPGTIKFEYQNSDEQMLMLVREYVAILWWYIAMTAVGVFVPLLLALLYKHLGDNGLLPFTIEYKWWLAAVVFWLMLLAASMFKKFVDWFYNVNIMTDQRFIDLDFATFSGYQVKETPLLKIQDVKDTHIGPWQMIFDMGTLEIYTASDRTTFALNNVPASSQVRDFIMDTVIAYTDQFKSDEVINAP